jgi:hypothetical protein
MHADFTGFIVGEVNAGLLKDLLYLEDRRKVSFHNSFVLLNPLKRRQTHPGGAGSCAPSDHKAHPRQQESDPAGEPLSVGRPACEP